MRIKTSEEIYLSGEEKDAFEKVQNILTAIASEVKDENHLIAIKKLSQEIKDFLDDEIEDYY